jgi:GntR family transcriptional repressor for pyruvate dehydrogenase complex
VDTISRSKLPDLVAEALAKFIAENQLRPGDRLPTEKTVSAQLGIGRTSVREGLRKLETLGVVESRQGDGVFLREVTVESLLRLQTEQRFPLAPLLSLTEQQAVDLVRVRMLIEGSACERAVARISNAEVDALRKSCAAMEAALNDPSVHMSHDLEFHRLIVEASGNTILPTVFKMIQDLIWSQYAVSITYPHAMERATRAHRRVLAAIERRDSAAAAESLEEHLADVVEMVRSSFRKRRQSSGDDDSPGPPDPQEEKEAKTS